MDPNDVLLRRCIQIAFVIGGDFYIYRDTFADNNFHVVPRHSAEDWTMGKAVGLVAEVKDGVVTLFRKVD